MVKSTGIIRRIDELGRVVLCKSTEDLKEIKPGYYLCNKCISELRYKNRALTKNVSARFLDVVDSIKDNPRLGRG